MKKQEYIWKTKKDDQRRIDNREREPHEGTKSKKTNNNQTYFKIPAYNIIIEICSRNAIRFFGSGKIKDDKGRLIHIFNYHSLAVYNLFEQNKKQEAEDYIWDHCLFNPKNKESK